MFLYMYMYSYMYIQVCICSQPGIHADISVSQLLGASPVVTFNAFPPIQLLHVLLVSSRINIINEQVLN